MGTLIGLMGLSRSALAADQEAINVTANNVANQNTVGYTRQVVRFTASDTVALNGFQNNGSTVTASTSSQRDRVLEQRLQQATSSASASGARLTALQDVEAQFGLSSTDANASSTALGSAVDGFFSSLQSLTANPTDQATRSSVLTAASTLASAFNQAADGINGQIATLNGQIATAAQQIDGLTSTIAKLNGQITALSPNADAGTLEDQRQAAIQQLSNIVGVNQVKTENNGVTLTLSTGAILVSGQQSFSVSTTAVAGKTELLAGDPPVAQASIDGGEIGGMIEARDTDLPGMLSSLDTLAYGIGTAVNAQNQAGLTPSGSAGAAIFSLPTSASGAAVQISVTAQSGDDIATAGASEGANGTLNAAALANLGMAQVAGGQTASDFFGNFIGALGNTVQSATTDSTAQSAAQTQAQTQRDSFSAVNLDDEASALTQYQRSYEAAAKVFQIVNQMMADTLNLGTAETYS
jgi:flagellar hook-associated protein 1 FlgK